MATDTLQTLDATVARLRQAQHKEPMVSPTIIVEARRPVCWTITVRRVAGEIDSLRAVPEELPQ